MKTTLPIEIFAIEDDGFHLKTKVVINGLEACVIIDTGASRSVFDKERILNFVTHEQLQENDRMSSGLGTNTMQSQKVQLDKLQLGAVTISPYEATVLDLSHVNSSYEQLDIEPIDGVLGSDIMVDYDAIIDYQKKELVLSIG